MTLARFEDLMSAAEEGGYAVGYFESWDMHSLMAVADAAMMARSPVMLGFSGLYLTHPERLTGDPLSSYAALGLDVCRQIDVPAALVFNESPDRQAVLEAAKLGFGLVMFSDERLDRREMNHQVRETAALVHQLGAAIEGELFPLPGIDGLLAEAPAEVPLTGVDEAAAFVSNTDVDALAVNLGQMHLHGRQQVRLNLDRLKELKEVLEVPLALHGASSVKPEDLQEAVKLGIRKINVGSMLKQAYFESLRGACNKSSTEYNPYITVGSGLDGDVLLAARLALKDVVVELMSLFGSAGKA